MNKRHKIALTIALALTFVTFVFIGCKREPGTFGAQGVSNFDSIHIAGPTAIATATPVLMVDSDGVSNIFEIRDGATPVWYVSDGGDVTQTGAQSQGALSVAGNVVIAQPTAQATATPMVYANTAADAPDLLVIAKDGTPEVYVHNDGTLDVNGNKIDLDADADTSITVDTDDQIDIEIAGADDFQFTANTFSALSGSTIAADTLDDTSGSGLTVNANVDVTGTVQFGANNLYPVGYASSGQQLVWGAETGVTDTVTAAHGLTTVTWALCSLAEDPDTDAGDPVVCTVEINASVVTVKLWQDDWSAGATAAKVNWMVVGTP